jgi:hypothetical protein
MGDRFGKLVLAVTLNIDKPDKLIPGGLFLVFYLMINGDGIAIAAYDYSIESQDFMMNLVGRPGGQEEPERCGEEEMKNEQDEKEFDVGTLVDDDIIEDQCKKQDGNADQGDQDGLGKFTKPGLPEYFAVGSYEGVKAKPEYRDNRYAVI